MGLDVKNKIKTISENFDLINTIRRCHTSDKKLLAKALDISWPTLNTSLKNILYDSSGPIIQNDMGEYDVDKSYGFFLGIAVGGTETKVSIIDFSLNPIGDKSDFFPEYKNIKYTLSKIKNYKKQEKEDKKQEKYDVLACYYTPEFPQEISNMCNDILNEVVSFFEKSDLCDLLGVGITFPGVFGNTNSEENVFRMGFCPNLSRLVGISLIDLFDKRIIEKIKTNNISFVISHDTEAVTVFEKESLYNCSNKDYAYRDKSNVACVYLGIGLGMGLIINNELLHGSCNSVGEIGHLFTPIMTLNDDQLNEKELKEKKDMAKRREEILRRKPHCYCGIDNCLENKLRVEVFNALDQTEYIDNTTKKELNEFCNNHPYRYRILKNYISYLMNLIINLLNVDMIIFAGRIFNEIDALKFDIDRIKITSGLTTSASACKVIFGSGRIDAVAAGGAILSFFNYKDKRTDCTVDKKMTTKWNRVYFN